MMTLKTWKPLSALALALTLTACQTLGLDLAPTATLTPVDVTAAPTDPADAPTPPPATPEPEPTTAPAPGVLPQAAYFLAEADGQIWRLDPDGRTLTQITHERAAITEFDVSPADGALVYITENTLIRTDAEGGQRTVLLIGPALTGAEGEGVTSTLRGPVWSPDGRQIAYGLNGVNLLPAEGGTSQMIQPSDPVPASRVLARFYRPYAWSPDGARLVLLVNFWQEGLVYAVKDLSQPDSEPLEITTACCEPVWSRDSQSLYFVDADSTGLGRPGLRRVDAATGEVVTLIEGRHPDERTLSLVLYPAEAADGTLYFLMATVTPDANFIYPYAPGYQLYQLPAGAQPGDTPTLVRGDTLAAANGSGAAWALEPGAAGVLVSVVDPDAIPIIGGALAWLPLDGGQPVAALPGTGSAPQW